jgi:hypothetical protein
VRASTIFRQPAWKIRPAGHEGPAGLLEYAVCCSACGEHGLAGGSWFEITLPSRARRGRQTRGSSCKEETKAHHNKVSQVGDHTHMRLTRTPRNPTMLLYKHVLHCTHVPLEAWYRR